jgi:hypothetical protein
MGDGPSGKGRLGRRLVKGDPALAQSIERRLGAVGHMQLVLPLIRPRLQAFQFESPDDDAG